MQTQLYESQASEKTDFQKITVLPVERCTTYCRLDVFNPYLIKERSLHLKRNGTLFTCFSCRAIQIEVTNALDTNSFILALKGLWQENVLLDPSCQTM